MSESSVIPAPAQFVNGRKLLQLHGHEDLPLIDPGRGYLVKRGYLSVYLVRYEDGIPSGRRRYLFSCHEGCLLIGMPVIHEGKTFGLVAVNLEEGECEELEVAGWGRNEEEFLAAKHWCDHLCRLLSETTSNDYAERADAEGMFSIDAGNKLRPPTSGVFRLVLEQGRLTLFGNKLLAVTPEMEPMALMGDSWFGVEAESSGHFALLQPGQGSSGIDKSLASLARLFVQASVEQQNREAEAEKQRLIRLSAMQLEAQGQAVQHLTFAPDKPKGIKLRETPLLTCLDAISQATEIKLDTDTPPRTTLPMLEQLGIIARNSGTRMRKVKLEEGWWDSDGGTILAFRKETKTPVVLISVSRRMGLSRHYEILDPEKATQVIFTPEMHEELAPEAYVFLRPLPVTEGPITFSALAKFTFAPFLKDIRLMLLLSLAGGILGAAMPIANRMMVDEVIPDSNRRLLFDLAIGLAAMSLGLFFFGMSQGLISLRVKTGLTAHLQSAIMDRLLRLPTRFFRKYSSGDLLNRAMMISEISAGFSMTVMSAIFGLLSTVMMLALCFYYSQKLAFLAVISAAITSIFSISFSYIIRNKALDLEIRGGKLFGLLVQMVAGVSKLQTAGAEARAFKQWAKEYGEQLHLSYSISYLSHWSGLINTVIQTLSTIALYYFAGKMVEASQEMRALSPMTPPLLTVGIFFAVQGAFGSVVGGVAGFFGTFLTMHQQSEKRKLVRPILEEPIEGGKGRIDPGRLDGHIMIKQLCFRYAPNSPLVLNNVDLHAHPGEFIAIVGSSGSGKSTLLRLLLGFETAESGQILFDKKDVKDLDMIAVRRQTGVVLQDGKINTGTIYHNIAGAAQITLDDAWEAAEAAGMGDDIRGMPMGMHTLVPEGGTTLSGGQKQRLLIARSLALKPRIIFFDEATSALDNRTQETVTKSLGERRITRIIVAHRLSTIMDADRIYVFEQGMVVQKGTFKELASVEGPFKLMADRQMA